MYSNILLLFNVKLNNIFFIKTCIIYYKYLSSVLCLGQCIRIDRTARLLKIISSVKINIIIDHYIDLINNPQSERSLFFFVIIAQTREQCDVLKNVVLPGARCVLLTEGGGDFRYSQSLSLLNS